MLEHLKIFMIASVFILISAVILIINTVQREHEFIRLNNTIQKSAVHGASYAINIQLLNKQHHVRLFLDEYAVLLQQLNLNPSNETIAQDIKTRLQQRFPDFFAFTITDSQGTPTLIDFDSLIGDACKRDLYNFSKNFGTDRSATLNKVFIHPQPFHYHYDIMAPLAKEQPRSHIFFSSFNLKEITDILKTHEIPGQNLILVKQSDPKLIEATKEGARDKISREVYLSKQERKQIRVYEDIPNTHWRLINLPDANYEKQHLYNLWKEAIIIMIIVTLAQLLLIFVLVRFFNRK
ncbi:MAG: hypothetical protein KAG28_07275 [Cocleimonas sp.]|nr:hypothetical protein [Cocleimonas sp.]